MDPHMCVHFFERFKDSQSDVFNKTFKTIEFLNSLDLDGLKIKKKSDLQKHVFRVGQKKKRFFF